MEKNVDKNEKVQELRPCPQDCRKCGPWQQLFCCTKMVFELSETLQDTRKELQTLRAEINEVRNGLPEKTLELSNPTI